MMEEEALVPLVRKRKKKPEVGETKSDGKAGAGAPQKLFSQTINISKREDSAGKTISTKLSNRITQKFNLKTKEDRKLYYIIFAEVNDI